MSEARRAKPGKFPDLLGGRVGAGHDFDLPHTIEAHLSASCPSRISPLTVLTPSKPWLIFPRIVGVKIDVQARYSAISKLEDVAETAARCFAPCPRLTRHSAL